MYFSVPSFSEVEGTLLAFRNHILVLRLVGINHVRLSGDVLSQILKEGLFFFAGHIFECVIFTSVSC